MPYVRTFAGASNSAEESDGVWQLVNTGLSGPSDLVFVKTTNTPSGNVEVHIDSGASGYQTRILDAVSNFASETNGTWGVVNDDPGSGTNPDLFFIKTANTPSGNVEVHIDSGASAYQTRLVDAVSDFTIETDGVWTMVYSGSSLPDLVFIETANTPSGNVEVHIASGASNYGTRIADLVTTFACEQDGTWGVVRNPSSTLPDLYLITTANTPSGNVEVHIASGASNYQTRTLEIPTTFVEETDGVWGMLVDDQASFPDLGFVKTANTPSGNVEVHLAQFQPTLNVPLYSQLTDMWCWAASAEMAMSFEGNDVPQCTQANSAFGLSDCCNGPTQTGCVQGGNPGWSFDTWNFSYETTAFGTAMSFGDLSYQFDIGLPVPYAWSWDSGGGHVMVAIGTTTISGSQLVCINNPWPPDTGDQTWLTYASWVQQPGSYTHQMDWYNLTPAAGGPPAALATTPATTGERMTDDAAEGPPVRFGSARAAAEEGLRLLPALGAGGTRGGAPGLELGNPLRIFYVRRDELARYEPGADPRPLLADVGELLYPVTGGGEGAAAVRVVEGGDGWTIKSVGEANLARDLEDVRSRDAAAAPSESFVVHVPSLYRIFIGRFDTVGTLVLTPVHNDAARGFRRGVAQPGAEILARLGPDAARGRDAVTDVPRA